MEDGSGTVGVMQMVLSSEWYMGRVLSLVAGTDNWFNVEYDNVLSLNLMEDVDRGDV